MPREIFYMQMQTLMPVSPEVRAYADAQRQREFEAVNAEAKTKMAAQARRTSFGIF